MKFRIKDGYDPYNVIANMIQILVEDIYMFYRPGEVIARMGYKYEYEKEYEYDNELLLYSEWGTYNTWEHDWNEGQRDIDLVWFIPVEEVGLPDYQTRKIDQRLVVFLKHAFEEEIEVLEE